MKAVAVVVLAAFVVVGVWGQAEGPPPPQPGDDELMQITVGEARRALWYKEQYEMVEQELELCRAANDRLEASYLRLQTKLAKAAEVREEVEQERSRWKVVAVAAGIAAVVEAVVLLVQAGVR